MSEWDRKHVETYLKDIESGDAIAIIWTTEDVRLHAEELGAELTNDEAREVLYRVNRKHDANYGICWDVLGVNIEMLLEDKKGVV